MICPRRRTPVELHRYRDTCAAAVRTRCAACAKSRSPPLLPAGSKPSSAATASPSSPSWPMPPARASSAAPSGISTPSVSAASPRCCADWSRPAWGLGVDTRWLMIDGDAGFFAITKRIHNCVRGWPGDGGPLGDAERRHYESVVGANRERLHELVSPGDIVILHDPQTAGMVE